MAITPKKNKHRSGDQSDHRMASLLDEMSEFERFRHEILPELRKMVTKGASAEAIYRRYQAHAAARTITIAMTEDNPATALAAAKEILDRGGGKAVERKEITVNDMTDEQLDELIKKELGATNENEELQN